MKMKLNNYVDISTLAVMVITMILFVGAIFIKGFTHDILLEAGIFLVSVKLIIMSYKNGKSNEELICELKEIKMILKDNKIMLTRKRKY
jgi:hypothetical protein